MDYVYGIQNKYSCNLNGLNNLYYENKLLKSNFYLDKIHIVSFTFNTLKQLYNTKQFQELFY